MAKFDPLALRAGLPARPSVPTTQQFAALHDHARLPSRFWGRFTTTPGKPGG